MDLSYRKKWPEIKVEVRPEDYVRLGGPSKIKGTILQADSQWLNHLPVYELQRNRLGDVFGCVSFADDNCDEILHKRKYNSEININDRVVVVGSGTTPSVGNNPTKVSDWKRKNGIVLGEEKWPYPSTMTVKEYYNGGVVPQHLLDEGKKNLDVYFHGYEWVDYSIILGSVSVKPEKLLKGLQYSPLEVSVHGLYTYDNNGYVKWTGGAYTHEVSIVGHDKNGFLVFDSEASMLVKFRKDYPFGWPMIKYFEKKTPSIKDAAKEFLEDPEYNVPTNIPQFANWYKRKYGLDLSQEDMQVFMDIREHYFTNPSWLEGLLAKLKSL